MHKSKVSCRGRRNESLQSEDGRKTWPAKETCRLKATFGEIACSCHWSMDRIGLSAFISHTSPLVRVSSGYLHNLIVFGSFFSYFQIQLHLADL
ncbi:uncharacterized protein LOC131073610 isoform X9 [Cryptomeria japonica]|uniref:uncharacterized protein LOC131073610 isoform X9 n=1 Tax=Cryptomeria japonica TaxID=3369 RepID=UPI0025AC1BA3|nr:uncharacterized protein LOC131073610 isoform X9 [Cryptomeria japonica]